MLSLGIVTISISACSPGSEPIDQGQGTCAPIAFLDGREYMTQNTSVRPVPGEAVGEIRIPACNDTGQAEAPPDEYRSVSALPDVDPSVAVVDAEVPEVIYVAADLNPYPAEINRYLTPPKCVQGDAPVELQGPWLSIPGTNANKEPDPVPPYQVEVLVVSSSAPRYENAELLIGVAPELGMPITHADVEESLWGGGSLRVTATCDGGRFVAEDLTVIPPG
jgi:hypothetical protein